jgi:hypothetical protein
MVRLIASVELDRRTLFIRRFEELQLAGLINRNIPQFGDDERDTQPAEFMAFMMRVRLPWESGE